MVTAQDFLTIADRLRAAQDVAATQAAQEELRAAVEEEVHALFTDPKYPKRRRSFAAIRSRLAIFDDSSDEFSQARLRQLLFGMGARVHRGEGDDALWTLPPASEGAKTPEPPVKQRLGWRGRLTTLASAAAVVLMILGFWEQVFGETLRESVLRVMPSPADAVACEDAAGDIFMELLKCWDD